MLRVYGDFQDQPGLAEFIYVDDIEIFPTAQPFNVSQVRGSGAENPESFDALTGVLSVAESNGQAVRAAFKLREQLYFVKERSLYVTQDDGTNEPDRWTISEVSRSVGTPSVNGVDVGEDWAVIAGRDGVYIFGGSEPVKISQEIQPTWDQINWLYGHTIWIRVDTRNKRVLVGVPSRGERDISEHDFDDGLPRPRIRRRNRVRKPDTFQFHHEETLLLWKRSQMEPVANRREFRSID